jgi:hypothetical protein
MRTLFLTVLMLLGLGAAPAAADCVRRSGSDAGVRVQVTRSGDRSAVQVCDGRTGRVSVLARARGRRGARGTRVAEADAAGRRVAWTVSRTTRGRTSVVLHAAVVGRRGAREVERRVIFSGARSVAGRAGAVAVTTRGDLAWAGGTSTRLQVAGSAAVAVGTASDVVAFEDDRTLRWEEGETYRFVDLAPPVVVDGCPRRAHFKPYARSAEILVTRAQYVDPLEIYGTVLRVCLRGSGRDLIVDQSAEVSDGAGEFVYVGGLVGRWLVLTHLSGDRYSLTVRVSLVDAATGEVARTASAVDSGVIAPVGRTPVVVTDRGVPVWVNGVSRASVITIGPDGAFVTLDASTGGPIADLRADGAAVSWTNGGVPHTVEPA